ncbi:ExeM/NucH family extracellular endonuclease [Labedella endophytica]|uniref:ExeM/NucH family extracellular endonuclease n=1 Tax=Labedella endophytica TaxID=1523160 RepID=UPI001FB85DAE|nr:ExeM/NucH family extracellular endonuclease [Labedella endophytica]
MSQSATRPGGIHTARAGLATLLGGALVAAPFIGVAAPASAAVDGSDVVISEAFLNGGSNGAAYTHKFVELYNPTDAAISLDGMSIQYRSAAGDANPSGVYALSGSVAAGGYYLVQGTSNGSAGAALPAADATLPGNMSFAGAGGTIFLADQATVLTAPPTGSIVGNDAIVDLVGYGTSKTFETAAAPAASVTTSIARTAGADTDSNAADFVAGAPTPTNAAGTAPEEPEEPGEPEPEEPVEPGEPITIAAIQGTGTETPLAGQTVTTTGVVTAAYPAGGFNGYYIQTPGTGGDIELGAQTASDAVFVYSAATVGSVAVGDHVQVTGTASEFNGLTQVVVPTAAGLTVLDTAAEAPVAAAVSYPTEASQREALEGMLLAPEGAFTVSNTYSTNQYAEIGLAAGDTPLITPTEIARPGSAEYTAAVAANAARGVTLDDGASINFLGGDTNKAIPLPYLTQDDSITVGSAVEFTEPVIIDYRNNTWKFQPTTQLTAEDELPAAFSDVRPTAPDAVGGDIQIASFNVLNYFTTTGDELNGCTFYTDRAGDPVTVNSGCDARGAAEDEDLERQEAKIVAAINGLGAEVVSLEEIENSVKFGADRDESLSILVDALNEAAGSDVWAFVPSPDASELPSVDAQDVIRNAFIYKQADVQPVGDSSVLLDAAFNNARQPLAQEFQVTDADGTFIAIVNHFKSKGSGSGADADQNDGQGGSNASRVAQAEALVEFSSDLRAELGTDEVFLIGDFNAYTMEDPSVVLMDAGYVDQGSKTGEYSYSFSGQSGSLDHIYASPAADAKITGVDIWNINSGESIAKEYSRYNYNATDFYDESVYRSSDHDPVLVGYSAEALPVELNLIDINDFHGRIDANTVKFAGTIEQLKAEYGDDNSMFVSSGDNVGASVFASSSQNDQPTIDVLNTLELIASAVGNHEFDQGFADLTDRIETEADWDYLGANVYEKGTTNPALQEYTLAEIDGLTVAFIGTVTEETPTLVSPANVATLDFGDPVEAVNRVAGELTDGDAANGEADVIVANYHEGAGAGTPDGATLEEEIAEDGVFTDIVTKTSAAVDVIFTGHTHKQYAWDAPIPGVEGETRPVLQTGNYGEFIGNVVLTLDPATGEVQSYVAKNVPRTTVADDVLVATYPRVAEVKAIVDAALAEAAVIGNQPKGSVTADITTAFGGGSYVDGKWTGGTRDDRASESTLGNTVADALQSILSSDERGGAEIGVVNSGGLRGELIYAPDGTITYSEANAVLPFLNNLYTTTLTGANFKAALEQQWQTNADGTIPSRPFLKLGLSDNVEYTYDAARAQGDRITGIWVDGEPIVASQDYRIGSFSFLLQGGDNFRVFGEKGKDTRDSGLIDRDAWISYLEANPGLSPEFDRKSVSVTNAPTDVVEPGSTVTFDVSSLDLTSLGSPVNTSLSAEWAGTDASFDPITVANGAASVSLTVPADAAAASEIVLTAQPSGTTFRVPVSVNAAEEPQPEPGKPTTPPVGVDSDDLPADAEGDISVAPDVVNPGDEITAFVGTEYAGDWVAVWMYSAPTLIADWQQVSAAGTVTATIPLDATAGEHIIAVTDADNAVLGWDTITVLAADGDPGTPGTPGDDGGSGDGSGNGSGDGSGNDDGGLAVTGATVAPIAALALLLLMAGAAVLIMRRRAQA